jgi:hypothetical protein
MGLNQTSVAVAGHGSVTLTMAKDRCCKLLVLLAVTDSHYGRSMCIIESSTSCTVQCFYVNSSLLRLNGDQLASSNTSP